MYGIQFEPPKRRAFAEYATEARRVCTLADPPVSFREALSVYRQLRWGSLVFRCTFVNDQNKNPSER